MSKIKDYGYELYVENFAEDLNQPTGFEDYDRVKEQLAWEAEQERLGGGRF